MCIRDRECYPSSIYLSRKPPNAGASPPAVFRFYAARGASPVLSALARSGGFQRTQRSQRTRESRTASISNKLPKMKNKPQIISATLTRNNGVYSTSRVRMGALLIVALVLPGGENMKRCRLGLILVLPLFFALPR